MTKTTEGERASIMGEHKLHGKDIILRLVQDADRLVAIERQVRELADECEQRGHVGPKVPRNFGMRDVADKLRAIIDAHDAGKGE